MWKQEISHLQYKRALTPAYLLIGEENLEVFKNVLFRRNKNPWKWFQVGFVILKEDEHILEDTVQDAQQGIHHNRHKCI